MAKVQIDIPMPAGKGVNRAEIARAVIEEIVERTQNKSLNKDGKKLAAYSKTYRESLDFELAGKTGKVNLTMTGDMLAALDILEVQRRKATIGIDGETEESDRAHGHITGANNLPVRNFLGISNRALARIIAENSDLTQYRALEFVRANYDNKQSERL